MSAINHVYSTPYGSSSHVLDASVPSGTYVAFEDLPLYYGPDYNYTDEQFVFTNVGAVASPEPATLTLAGLGFVGLCGYVRRKRKLAAA